MNPVLHPLVKTSVELRRSINRLEVFAKANPNDEHVVSGKLDEMVDKMKDVRLLIPASMRDADIAGG